MPNLEAIKISASSKLLPQLRCCVGLKNQHFENRPHSTVSRIHTGKILELKIQSEMELVPNVGTPIQLLPILSILESGIKWAKGFDRKRQNSPLSLIEVF